MSKATRKIRILVADDHVLIRSGIRATLEDLDRPWELVGEAATGRQAVRLAKQLKPDVVIMDVAMPEMNGFEATRQICGSLPEVRVLILTMYDSEQVVLEALEAGAQGYLLKSDAGSELLQAVAALAEGKPFFTSKVARLVLAGFLRSAPKASSLDTPLSRLSSREREIVQLLAEGNSTKQVALALNLSTRTAETHRKNLMAKLHCHSVADLVRYAVRNNIIEA